MQCLATWGCMGAGRSETTTSACETALPSAASSETSSVEMVTLSRLLARDWASAALLLAGLSALHYARGGKLTNDKGHIGTLEEYVHGGTSDETAAKQEDLLLFTSGQLLGAVCRHLVLEPFVLGLDVAIQDNLGTLDSGLNLIRGGGGLAIGMLECTSDVGEEAAGEVSRGVTSWEC